ncbi:carbamoyltransferase HypF [Clostridium disporicum]|uniref:Carbamoyltransferase n=1 Tax=Clostridium disporicum TaxID=84024 RepID=A0A173XFM1_9CLOT|nr:carbamoyltransferase HypF [Clostridium disporicum]CUN50591.1 carbamoyltransferase HypF2 [Clostridium disporicum]
MNKLRKVILVQGIVQGVGFRPFVYKLAVDLNLKGWVNNTSLGVIVDIEGEEEQVLSFIEILKNNTPPLAKVLNITIHSKELIGYENFEIKFSKEEENISKLISPDISICDDCKEEIFDVKNRRYRYPFTNCTNCGPRFSIIKKLPYDRKTTTMEAFKMCPQCKKEYTNPLDRRFHAQPNACPECGPQLCLVDNKNQKIDTNDSIKEVISLIKKGKILAIKGIGGFHLVCDGRNYEAIKLLRDRKKRPYKPMAVMVKDLEVAKKYCYLSKREEEVILSNKRPIVILKRRMEIQLPDNLAPYNKTLGVMLPYTPLHYLLFDEGIEILVMTSANISGEPMIYKNEEAMERLNNIVDYFLMHNRDIYLPIDDSVTRVSLKDERTIRVARGYSPITVNMKGSGKILACGSHLKNTLAISKEDNIFISQYIGDMENAKTYNSFERNLNNFKQIYKIEPEIIAYDLHPDYWSNDLVNNFKGERVAVQHHHSHIASCIAENNINEKVIGVAYDGTGYGDDGNIWGGEFLICNLQEYKRVGHLNYFSLPGGESAIKEPWKIALSKLYKTYGEEIYDYLPEELNNKKTKLILTMIKNNINCPLTSSMGRLFDGIAALVGFNRRVTFEGEAAIFLENISDKTKVESYKYEINKINEKYIIDTDNIIKGIINDIKSNVGKEVIAIKFHNSIINCTVDMCKKIREESNINCVALSGGVFQNIILFEGIYNGLISEGFEVFTHKKIPCNDSGISFGQLMVAREAYKGDVNNVYSSTSGN